MYKIETQIKGRGEVLFSKVGYLYMDINSSHCTSLSNAICLFHALFWPAGTWPPVPVGDAAVTNFSNSVAEPQDSTDSQIWGWNSEMKP